MSHNGSCKPTYYFSTSLTAVQFNHLAASSRLDCLENTKVDDGTINVNTRSLTLLLLEQNMSIYRRPFRTRTKMTKRLEESSAYRCCYKQIALRSEGQRQQAFVYYVGGIPLWCCCVLQSGTKYGSCNPNCSVAIRSMIPRAVQG
jgi:hypothetical protein